MPQNENIPVHRPKPYKPHGPQDFPTYNREPARGKPGPKRGGGPGYNDRYNPRFQNDRKVFNKGKTYNTYNFREQERYSDLPRYPQKHWDRPTKPPVKEPHRPSLAESQTAGMFDNSDPFSVAGPLESAATPDYQQNQPGYASNNFKKLTPKAGNHVHFEEGPRSYPQTARYNSERDLYPQRYPKPAFKTTYNDPRPQKIAHPKALPPYRYNSDVPVLRNSHESVPTTTTTPSSQAAS